MQIIAEKWELFGRFVAEDTPGDAATSMIQELFRRSELNENARVYWLLLYMTYYDLGMATRHFVRDVKNQCWSSTLIPAAKFRFERRYFRGGIGRGKAIKHIGFLLNDISSSFCSFDIWAQIFLSAGNPQKAWDAWYGYLLTVPYNGPWAAFKTLKWGSRILNWTVEPSLSVLLDRDRKDTAGPFAGGQLLQFGSVSDTREPDMKSILYKIKSDLGLGILDAEDKLCRFNALHNGTYYPKEDFDDCMEEIGRPGQDDVADTLYSCREVFPEYLRGERSGWFGSRKNKKLQFKKTGELSW